MDTSICVEGSLGPPSTPPTSPGRTAPLAYTCRISGLGVRAEMELPGTIPAAVPAGTEDVFVRRRPVPEWLEGSTTRGKAWELNDQSFLLDIAGVARFCVTGGKTVDVQHAPGADPAEAMPFLLGTCFGALLLQRGGLVLHASSVAMHARAYVFCGRSGIGKSTLAAALCRNGCHFVNDDVCAIGVDGDGHPAVWPDGRRLKLFEGSIEQLALTGTERGMVRAGLGKHYVEPPGPGVGGPVPVAAIYILRDESTGTLAGIRSLSLLEGAQALLSQNFRPRLAAAMASRSQQLQLTAALLRHAPVFTLTRARDLSRLAETATELQAHWRSVANEQRADASGAEREIEYERSR